MLAHLPVKPNTLIQRVPPATLVRPADSSVAGPGAGAAPCLPGPRASGVAFPGAATGICGDPMKLARRRFLHLAAGAGAVPTISRIAWAQAYPVRPVHIIVGYPAGGSNDILARLMAQWLSERMGQQYVIENRPGAGSNIATEAVVRADP